MTKIKICGIRRQIDIDFVNEAKPDYIGFVFFKKSKRYIEPEFALHLKKLLNPDIKSVGVFVNTSYDEILSNEAIDIIQLHGDEDEEFIKKLKSLTKKPVIKAFCAQGKKIKTSADYILFDAPCENSYGGLGKTFNLDLIPKVSKLVFLAGGLNADNIKEAIVKTHPYCVDVSSGVETEGFKDGKKILEIVQLVHNIKE